MVPDNRIYYEDQSAWSAEDFYALWRYLNRLFQYIGPSESVTYAVENIDTFPPHVQARIRRVAAHQATRTGKRDEELSALDLDRMSPETRYLMKHMLISMKRYKLALERFPNLAGLEDVGELGSPLYLDEKPRCSDEYLTKVGIYL